MSCIKDWPWPIGHGKSCCKLAPAALGDTELLALILLTGHSSPRTSASTSPGNCCTMAVPCVPSHGHGCGTVRTSRNGPAKAADLLAVGELARRLAATPLRHGERFTTSGEVFVPRRCTSVGLRDRPQGLQQRCRHQSAAISFGTDAYPPCNGRPCLKFDQQGFSAMGPGAVYLVDGTQSFALTATRTRALHPVPLGWQPVALTLMPYPDRTAKMKCSGMTDPAYCRKSLPPDGRPAARRAGR